MKGGKPLPTIAIVPLHACGACWTCFYAMHDTTRTAVALGDSKG